ncbi:MAG: hypothetical protein WCH61_00055 [bacterium]
MIGVPLSERETGNRACPGVTGHRDATGSTRPNPFSRSGAAAQGNHQIKAVFTTDYTDGTDKAGLFRSWFPPRLRVKSLNPDFSLARSAKKMPICLLGVLCDLGER